MDSACFLEATENLGNFNDFSSLLTNRTTQFWPVYCSDIQHRAYVGEEWAKRSDVDPNHDLLVLFSRKIIIIFVCDPLKSTISNIFSEFNLISCQLAVSNLETHDEFSNALSLQKSIQMWMTAVGGSHHQNQKLISDFLWNIWY